MSEQAKAPGVATEATSENKPTQGSGVVTVRFSPDATFKREAQFKTRGIDKEARTCELSFSSELPVSRGAYMEVLSHDPANCDLSRLNNAHPLLLNHDPEDQVGVVEKAWIGDDKKGRAIVRFSKTEDGESVWQDVVDGIRRLVSVGYRIVREVSCVEENGREVCTFAWQPYEISIVSVPADATVGIGRSETISASQEPKKDKKIMAEVINEAPKRDFSKDATEILAIRDELGKKEINVREMADSAIRSGWTVEQFRTEAMKSLPSFKPIQSSNPLADVKAKDWKNYSISRAICMQIPGSKQEGFEAEMNAELAIKSGKRAEGFYIPDEAFTRNLVAGGVTVTSNTLGGYVALAEGAPSEFIEVLRNKSQVLNLGARVMNLTNSVVIPRQYATGTANWVAETTASTLTGIGIQGLTLSPKAISAYHQYSKQLLMQSNPSIDALVRDDIVQTLALAIDLAALHGAGSSDPTGIAGTTGIGTVALATDGLALANTTAYPAMVSLETKIAAANADSGALAYLMRPGHRGALRTSARFASSDTPVWDPASNTVNGYRAEVTNQIATNLTTGTATTICSAIFFGNWNELLIANFGATDLVVDPYSAGANGVVRLYARRWCDVGVRHPASFAVLGGVLTT